MHAQRGVQNLGGGPLSFHLPKPSLPISLKKDRLYWARLGVSTRSGCPRLSFHISWLKEMAMVAPVRRQLVNFVCIGMCFISFLLSCISRLSDCHQCSPNQNEVAREIVWHLRLLLVLDPTLWASTLCLRFLLSCSLAHPPPITTTTSSHHPQKQPPSHRPTIPPSHRPTVPPSHHPTIPPSHNPTITPSHHPTIPPSHHAHTDPSTPPPTQSYSPPALLTHWHSGTGTLAG